MASQNAGKRSVDSGRGQKSAGNPGQPRDENGQFVAEDEQGSPEQRRGSSKRKSADEEE